LQVLLLLQQLAPAGPAQPAALPPAAAACQNVAALVINLDLHTSKRLT
jgi:hypothetical protein